MKVRIESLNIIRNFTEKIKGNMGKELDDLKNKRKSVKVPRDLMTFEWYMSQIKPYYLEQEEYDKDGNLIRTRDPNILLDNYNPLPDNELQRKMNFFYMPYNRQQHLHRFMTFDDKGGL